MVPESVPMLERCDDVKVSERKERQRRRGFLRTDMHTVYDVPFQALEAASTGELRKIAKGSDEGYSSELRAKARDIFRTRIDPQDRNTVETDL